MPQWPVAHRLFADIDLVVNVCTAVILILGLGRIVQRFGVTAGLILNPLLMVGAFIATADLTRRYS